MARPTRRSTRSKRKVDWVVNDETYGSTLLLPNATQAALALTLPKFKTAVVDPGGLGVTYAQYQFPEQDSGQEAYAVRGEVILTPSVWAAGSTFRAIMRIVVKPIDFLQPAPQSITDLNYTLFQPEFANERFLWQDVLAQDFGLGSVGETVRVAWKGTVRMRPDEALWIFFENQSGITQTLRIQPYLRTLMRADG